MMPITEEKIEAFLKRVPNATRNEPMAKRTNFRVGGNAKLHAICSSSDALVEAVTAALECDVPFYLYGGGSNILVSDDGFEGVMIQAANRRVTINEYRVTAEAGAITGVVARQSVEAGLTGFEWAIGVPGTIGGAVYGNAGCYGGEIKDTLESVETFDLNQHQKKTFANSECEFAYRESMFKHRPYLILSATFKLAKSEDPSTSSGRRRMEDIMKNRKEKQPLEFSSGGSTFKNFEFKNESELDILKRSLEVPEAMLKNKSISAGWLIEQAGMRGEHIGDAEVSQKHGNFFLNKGKARAQDILALISRVKMKVRDEFGIELQEEVQLVGF